MTVAIDSVQAFVGILKERKLLEPEQLADLTPEVLAKFSDPRLLARQLMQKGWLTAYQVNQIFSRSAQDLVLGSYVLLERLGEGGMGQVFKARHHRMDRIVALKVIRKEHLSNPLAVRRFRREIQAASQLSHPNIVSAFDANEVGDVHFFVMEYVEGIDLLRLVREHGPLPIGEACEYIRQAALGLQHASERGLIHRDIKPSNLVVTRPRPGSSDRPILKILDMGLARPEDPSDSNAVTQLTQDGRVVGTPDYMAPEQARNSSTCDIRADLYSLGCTLYYLLTGQVLFPGGTGMEKLLKHQMEEPPPVVKLRKDTPQGVQKILKKLLAKKPQDRFQTPAELAAALEPFCRRVKPVGRIFSRKPKTAVPGMAQSATVESEAVAADTVRGRGAGPAQAGQPLNWRRRWLLIGAAGGLLQIIVLLLLGLVVAMPADSNGPSQPNSPSEPNTLTAAASSTTTVGPANLRPRLPGATVLDQLEAARIPAAERVAGQPAELVAVLGEHQGRGWAPILNLALTLDNRQIIGVGSDHTIRWWDAATLRELGMAPAPEWGSPAASAISADGRLAATAYRTATRTRLRLFDCRNRQDRFELPAPPDWINSLTFSLDGRMLAAAGWYRRVGGGQSGVIKVWNTEIGELRWELDMPPTTVGPVALSFDGRNVAWVGRSPDQEGNFHTQVHVLRVGGRLGDESLVFRAPNAAINQLLFSPDGSTLVVGTGESRTRGDLILVDLNTGARRLIDKAHDDLITAAVFTFDSELLVTGGADGSLRRWDVAEGESAGGFDGRHLLAVQALAVSFDGGTLVSAGDDQCVRLWNLASGAERLAGRPAQAVSALAFSPDGGTLAALNREYEGRRFSPVIRLWDLASQQSVQVLRPQQGDLGSQLAYSPDGRLLAVSGMETGRWTNRVRLWDPFSGRELPSLPARTSVTGLAWSSDGRLLAVSTIDQFVRVFDVADATEKAAFRFARKGRLTALAFLGSETVLAGGATFDAAAQPNVVLKVWDVNSRAERDSLRIPSGYYHQGALSANGEWFAAVLTETEGPRSSVVVKVWDVATGNERASLPTGVATGMDFSPQGRLLALLTRSPRVQVWETGAGPRERARNLTFPGVVQSLAFAPDGRHLATGNGNGTVYILRLP
jgi:serine/threonine-protein kinase